MNPIFYIILGAALYMLAEELLNNLRCHQKEREERAHREAFHKENGVAIFREINAPIDAPLGKEEAK